MGEVRKRIQFIITLTVYVREKMPRVKNIIKRVGETCTIIACYSPIVLYLYGYIVYDYMTSNTDSSLTK